MIRAASTRLSSEFDAFLFSSVGEDRNGLLISVVSLLGRLNLDPWQEAACFAGQAPQTAAQKLASLIDALPDRTRQEADTVTLATRLVGLLPRRGSGSHESQPKVALQPVSTDLSEAAHSPIVRRILIAIGVGLLMAAGFYALA